MKTRLLDTWKPRINQLKMEAYVIYLAYKDPRVPWYAKILIICIIGYAFSPIDKLLNSLPVIGYLDHLVLVPLGVVWAFKKMIPAAVFEDCRAIARNRKKLSWMDRCVIVFICFLSVSFVILSTTWVMKDWNLVLAHWFRWFARMKFIPDVNTR